MSSIVLDQIRDLYRADQSPEYFAGGHAWSDGVVYRYTKDKQDYLVKVLELGKPSQAYVTQERLAFVDYLCQNGLSTLIPSRSVRGNLVESIPGSPSVFCYSWILSPLQVPKLGDPRLQEQFYRRWGAWLGKAHYLARDYPQWKHSVTADDQGNPLISWQKEWQHFFEWNQDPDMRKVWTQIRTQLETLEQDRMSFGFIHNDPHPGNILADADTMCFIDWDVANFHWFMMDIAICIYSEYSRVVFHSPYKSRTAELPLCFMRPFLQAYLEQNDLPLECFKDLELFLSYRRYIMYTVFYEQIRSSAPDYLQSFKEQICSNLPYLPPGLDLQIPALVL